MLCVVVLCEFEFVVGFVYLWGLLESCFRGFIWFEVKWYFWMFDKLRGVDFWLLC